MLIDISTATAQNPPAKCENSKFLEITLQSAQRTLTKLNIANEKVLLSLSLKDGVSRSIVKGPTRGPKWATSDPQKL